MNEKDRPKFDSKTSNPLKPLNIKEIPEQAIAVALKSDTLKKAAPHITAAGRGKIAEQILQLAFENDVKVRTDKDLVEILVQIELDSPIPSEAFLAVAEILSYVFKANGEADPFNAVFENTVFESEKDDKADETKPVEEGIKDEK